MTESKSRIRRRSRSFSISRDAVRDTRLSMEARGLLSLLLSYDDGWVFRASHLQKMASTGRDRYRRMLNELMEHGYLEITSTKNAKTGQFSGTEWNVMDEPDTARGPENPAVGQTGPLREYTQYKGAPLDQLLEDWD